MCKPMQNRGKRMKYYLRGKSLEHLILNPKKRTAKPLPSHPTAVRPHPTAVHPPPSIWTEGKNGRRMLYDVYNVYEVPVVGGAEPPR
jgi:hypothetical protein